MSTPLKGISGGGFNLMSLELFRFMNYQGKPIKLSFKERNIVISGPTGSGKTTILDALTFALFGRNSRLELPMVKTEDVCGKNGRVNCKFQVRKTNYQVIRGRDTKGKSVLELFIDNERVNGKIPELNEKIRSTILGMNYTSFIHSTIIRQDEMKALGSESSTNRLKILQNLFRLDIFDKAIKETQDRLAVINDKKIQITEKINLKEDQLKKIPDLEKNIEELNLKLKKRRISLQKLEKEQDTILKERTKQSKKYEQFQVIKSKMDKSQSELQSQELSLENTKEELKQYNQLKHEVKKLESEIKTDSKIDTEIRTLELLEKEKSFLTQRISDIKEKFEKEESLFKKDIQSKTKQIESINSRLTDLSTDIDYETAFKILNQEGQMLERISRISLEKTWNLPNDLIRDLIKEQNESKKELKTLVTNKKRINIDSFTLSEINKNLSTVKSELKTLKMRYDRSSKESAKIIAQEEKKILKLNFGKETQNRLRKLRTRQKTIENTKKILTQKKKVFEKQSDPKSKFSILETQIKKLRLEISDYKKDLVPFKDFVKDFKSLEKQIEEKKEVIENKRDQIARMDENIKNKKENLFELRKIQPEVKEIRKIREKLVHKENLLNTLKNEVFHIKGAPFYAINKILPRLGKKASYILSDLSNQRFKRIQLQRIEKGAKNIGFEINIQTAQGIRDIATFSGGERTQINAALRLAISDELSTFAKDQTNHPDYLKTLFIDEGDLGSLDTIEAQQAFVNKLFELSTKFKIILITHITEIAEQFPHSIQISRDQYGRSIIGSIS